MDLTWMIAAAAVVLIGISKAGFGGGLGMLTTPLCVLAFGPREAIGILLPLLCAGDLFSLRHYWGQWQGRNLRFLLPGVVAGIMVGIQCVGRFSPGQLNLAIGLLAVSFVIFQWSKDFLFSQARPYNPGHMLGLACGVGAGITSTFAHGAGPVVAVFLLPQKLGKEVYVGTTVLIFSWINALKLPFFAAGGILTASTLGKSLLYLPLIPLGVWIGVRLNRSVPDRHFTRVAYGLTLATGAHLIHHGLRTP